MWGDEGRVASLCRARCDFQLTHTLSVPPTRTGEGGEDGSEGGLGVAASTPRLSFPPVLPSSAVWVGGAFNLWVS